jgi:hypothetical protein
MKYILTFTIAIFSLCCNIALAANAQVNEPKNNSVEAIKSLQLPQDLLTKFNNELAKLKTKAESQKTAKQTERMMRFYWQYKNAFDAMPVNSQIDVLNIFSTGNDQGSKLKGVKLIDKAVEYMVLIDGGFTKENVSKLRKYHTFLMKFNPTVDKVLDLIVGARIAALGKDTAKLGKDIAKLDKDIAKLDKDIAKLKIKEKQSAARLEKLIALRKQMEILAK